MMSRGSLPVGVEVYDLGFRLCAGMVDHSAVLFSRSTICLSLSLGAKMYGVGPV